MSTPTPTVDVRRAADRFATRIDWLDSKHSFSFGGHYDPDNTHHGLLLVNNDDVVQAGTGFEPLHEGDAVRFTGTGGQRVTATEPAEVLVWEMPATVA